MSKERKAKMLEEWKATPHFPDIVLSKRLLEEADDGEDEGEIVIDLFDQLKIEDDKLEDEEDNFLLAEVSEQALILPFFSDEAVTISEVVLCPASNYLQLSIINILSADTVILVAKMILRCRCQKEKITHGTLWRLTAQVT